MSLLFQTNYSERNRFLKEVLLNTLSDNSREIQFIVQESGKDIIDLNEATNSLCSTLEAMFLHGLKDSLARQTLNAISGNADRRPEPSFWPPILIFMHKQVIEQIQSLSQINSEIGYCRSWIRSSLNESLFSSYLNIIRKNNSALNPYYKRDAFLKDSDLIEVASKILLGVEACAQINLPVNSSLLNQWSDYSLQLAGLWTIPLKSCPIASGIDVAGSITDTFNIPVPKPVQTNEFFSQSISNSPFGRTSNFAVEDLTHKENLDIFLQKVDEMDKLSDVQIDTPTVDNNERHSNTNPTTNEDLELNKNEQDVREAPCHGNSLTNLIHSSWSSEVANNNTNNNCTQTFGVANLSRSMSNVSSISSLRSPTDRCSYNALLKKHEDSRQVDWISIWTKFVGLHENESRGRRVSHHDGENINDSFENIAHTVSEKFGIDELQEMIETLCKLAREPGLDAQGFLCKGCAHPIGIGLSTAKVCFFSGNYYCEQCMNVELLPIPAKIIYNWDFRRYPVSKRAASFLMEFQSQPFIDLKLLNPNIYEASEEMAELQSLRIRLNFIRAYLYTCCPSSMEELQLSVFMKDYLFEHIHQYSIADLSLIRQGTLFLQLQKAVQSGERHILKCALCCVKGFICEICNSPNVLYPFHIHTTYRCESCGAVFHAECLNEHEPCPKCERKRKRQDLPLLNAIQNMS